MDSKQYTPEWGFVEGVTIEIRTRPGYFYLGRFFGLSKDGLILKTTYDTLDISLAEIRAVQILSGKWSLWQFAPKDAVVMIIRHYTGNPADLRVQFLQQHSWDHLQHHVDNPGAVVYEAPWWWIHEFRGSGEEE